MLVSLRARHQLPAVDRGFAVLLRLLIEFFPLRRVAGQHRVGFLFPSYVPDRRGREYRPRWLNLMPIPPLDGSKILWASCCRSSDSSTCSLMLRFSGAHPATMTGALARSLPADPVLREHGLLADCTELTGTTGRSLLKRGLSLCWSRNVSPGTGNAALGKRKTSRGTERAAASGKRRLRADTRTRTMDMLKHPAWSNCPNCWKTGCPARGRQKIVHQRMLRHSASGACGSAERCMAQAMLVLGLNSDESVKRLGKGETTGPSIRILCGPFVLAHLENVDSVVRFDRGCPRSSSKPYSQTCWSAGTGPWIAS